VSVNIPARQLANSDLIQEVRGLVAADGLEPSRLVLELTESLLMHDTEATVQRLRELKGAGVRLAIDDFGTGYSSLRYLRSFPADMLKLGGVFVSGLRGSAEEGALAMAIVNLGHTLRLETVAEDVTGAAQADRLRALGCHLAQGYFFSEPLQAGQVDALLARGGAMPAAPADEAALRRP
jgi:EAL domain-containing protein (putative c-di-GMP-specific phosphodiesterase class I)